MASLVLFTLIETNRTLRYNIDINWDSLVTQMVNHLPEMWETWVRPPGWEDSLEKEMATHSSILA